MWWTSEGERVLQGAEWELFREGLSSLWDDVEAAEEEDGPGTTGIALFDELSKAERLALLASVARGLTDEGEPCPELTALSEGTVAAIFAHIRYHWDDRDYLAGDVFLDLDPEMGDALKDQLGIDEDYYSAAPVDPTPDGLEEIRAASPHLRASSGLGRGCCGGARHHHFRGLINFYGAQ